MFTALKFFSFHASLQVLCVVDVPLEFESIVMCLVRTLNLVWQHTVSFPRYAFARTHSTSLPLSASPSLYHANVLPAVSSVLFVLQLSFFYVTSPLALYNVVLLNDNYCISSYRMLRFPLDIWIGAQWGGFYQSKNNAKQLLLQKISIWRITTKNHDWKREKGEAR